MGSVQQYNLAVAAKYIERTRACICNEFHKSTRLKWWFQTAAKMRAIFDCKRHSFQQTVKRSYYLFIMICQVISACFKMTCINCRNVSLDKTLTHAASAITNWLAAINSHWWINYINQLTWSSVYRWRITNELHVAKCQSTEANAHCYEFKITCTRFKCRQLRICEFDRQERRTAQMTSQIDSQYLFAFCRIGLHNAWDWSRSKVIYGLSNFAIIFHLWVEPRKV